MEKQVTKALGIIRSIDPSEVKCLTGSDKKEFEVTTKFLGTLVKDMDASESGRIGAKGFWKNYYGMKDKVAEMTAENERLESDDRVSKFMIKRLESENSKLREAILMRRFVGKWRLHTEKSKNERLESENEWIRFDTEETKHDNEILTDEIDELTREIEDLKDVIFGF